MSPSNDTASHLPELEARARELLAKLEELKGFL